MPRMLPRIVIPAVVAVAALGAVAQPAAAKPSKPRKFLAAFEATFKTTWDQPRAGGGGNCQGRAWTRGGGTEEWTVKTRTPQKVLVYRTGYGVGIHSSWDPHGDHGDLDASGRITREGMRWTDTEPGWCGGETASIPEYSDADCGTRLPEYELAFFGTAKPYPQIQVAPHMRREKLGFERCPLMVPRPLTAGAWPKVERAFPPARRLLASRKPVKVTGRQSWTNADEAALVGYSTSSSMTWTLTLTPR
jgi:hypothetical protein